MTNEGGEGINRIEGDKVDQTLERGGGSVL